MFQVSAKKNSMYGEYELVIKKFKGEYQAKNSIIRAYRNAFLNILQTFTEYTLSFIPRNNNVMDDSLATSTSMFKIAVYPNKKYEINIKRHLIVLDNVQYWQVFQDDKQINNFL